MKDNTSQYQSPCIHLHFFILLFPTYRFMWLTHFFSLSVFYHLLCFSFSCCFCQPLPWSITRNWRKQKTAEAGNIGLSEQLSFKSNMLWHNALNQNFSHLKPVWFAGLETGPDLPYGDSHSAALLYRTQSDLIVCQIEDLVKTVAVAARVILHIWPNGWPVRFSKQSNQNIVHIFRFVPNERMNRRFNICWITKLVQCVAPVLTLP